MATYEIKKKKLMSDEDLYQLSKEELISRLRQSEEHVKQLRNRITKQNKPPCEKYKEPEKGFDFSKYGKRKIALKLLYLGWDYDGFVQSESSANTIEDHLFQALVKGRLIADRASSNYNRCGRTDIGVSSFSQVISLTVRSCLTPENHKTENEIPYCKLLNGILPKSIRVLAWSPVEEDFSARFSCVQRTYKYWFPKGDLDLEKMNEAIKGIIGEHDFRNLCKMDVANGVTNFNRIIFDANVSVVNKNCSSNGGYDICEVTVVGKAFLYHQIRAIVAILFLIGSGKEQVDILPKLLDIDLIPGKPQYSLACATPLNLFDCEFEDLEWVIDASVMEENISTLQSLWVMHEIKATMLRKMLKKCEATQLKKLKNQHISLLREIQCKTYRPLTSRPRAETLQNRIEHYIKKGKIKVKPN